MDTRVFRRGSNFEFNVYRKPTGSGQHIHFFSWHPASVKRAVVTSMFLRAFHICSPRFLEGELEFIKNSFKRIAYPPYFLEDALTKARKSYFGPPLRKLKAPMVTNTCPYPSIASRNDSSSPFLIVKTLIFPTPVITPSDHS